MATIVVSADVTYTTAAATAVSITITTGTLAAASTAIGVSGFSGLCQVAMAEVANAVLAGEDGGLSNARARFAFAQAVEANPASFVPAVLSTIAADGVTIASSTDQAIINRVLSLWNQLSYGA